MVKTIHAVVAIVIIIALAGAGYFFYIYGDLTDSKKAGDAPPGDTNKAPSAYFSGNSTGVVSELIWFDANGSKDEDGVINDYEWEFGDGGKETSNSSMINHTYNMAGLFTVNLTVVDDESATDSYTREITIRPDDYLYESAFFLSQRGLPGVDYNGSKTFLVDEFAINLSISISFTGAEVNGSSIEDTALDVYIYNPYGSLTHKLNGTTRITQVFLEFDAPKNELTQSGDWEMVAECTKGSLYMDFEIEVLYGS
jgi:PKD repeat protein